MLGFFLSVKMTDVEQCLPLGNGHSDYSGVLELHILIRGVWGWAWEPAFLRSFWVMLLLPPAAIH